MNELGDTRSARNAARARFDARLTQVRADLAARGVGGRIADKASGDIKQALGDAANVARESKGIIAGAAAALALWFLRGPLLKLVHERLAARNAAAAETDAVQED